jgi:hypothetical protein
VFVDLSVVDALMTRDIISIFGSLLSPRRFGASAPRKLGCQNHVYRGGKRRYLGQLAAR